MSAPNLAAFPLPPAGVEAIRVQVKINGQWQTYDVSGTSLPAPAQPLHERRQQLPAPREANASRPAPAAPARQEAPADLGGRDPHRFLFTFGKFRGQYVEDICATREGQAELYDWMEFFQKEQARFKRGARTEPLHQSIDVAVAMVEAALLDIQFVPKPKYKTPRRGA